VATAQGIKGELYMTEEVTLLDTRAMEWEEWDGLKGSKIKVLSRFEGGEPKVFLLWLAPDVQSGPSRHWHDNVTEYHFILEGEQPTWMYESPDQGVGEGHNFILKEGYYLERTPGPAGIHGREPSKTSPTGIVYLIWRDGTGNFKHEPNAAEVCIDVPYPSK
jgi:hypothetical protein